MGLDNDLDDLLTINLAPPKMCVVRHVLNQLDEKQAEKVASLIDACVVPASSIAMVLTKNGYDITDKSITRLRRRLKGGGCVCPYITIC